MMKVRIKDIGRVVTGRTPPTANSEFWGGSVPFITPEDLQRGKDIVSTKRTITSEGLSVVGTASIPKGSVCVSCIGNIGYTGITTTQSVSNQQINSIVPNADYDCGYVYYLMRVLWPHFKILEGNATTVPILNKSDFESLEVEVLPTAERRRVASILSALDRKIALNRRKIATLEKMAKEIYDYWFVQYDFPDANGRPYKSSGGEMVYSPELKREIPKGWKACSINDCGRFCRGVAYTRADERPEGENTVLVMRGNNISEGHIIDDSNRVYVERELVSDEQYLNKFEVLFAMSSGSKEHVGKAAIGYDYPRGAAFGAFCSKFVPEGKYRYVVYSFLASAAYRSFIKQVCAGTGINNLKSEHFDVPLLAFPLANELLDRFNAVCAPLYESIFVATQDTERMESLCGFSLPLLMNGQVKVGE